MDAVRKMESAGEAALVRPHEPRGEGRPEPRGFEPRSFESRGVDSKRADSRSDSRSNNEPRNEGRSDRGERSGRFEPRGGSSSRFQRGAGAATGRRAATTITGRLRDTNRLFCPENRFRSISAKRQVRSHRSKLRPERPADASILSSFPEDEPIFAADVTEPLHEEHDHVPGAETYEEVSATALRGDVRRGCGCSFASRIPE